jgi:F5/8 type C domain.
MGPGWGRMLGLWIDGKPGESKAHTLDGFPTNEYFDWQWAQIISGVRAINMDRLPTEVEPVVWAIDDWNRNYKLGVVFECVVGQGRLLVSAIDITNPNSPNPVLQQFRKALIKYARSDCFQPTTAVSREALGSLFFDTRIMNKLHAKASVGGEPAGMVIDGDPNTFLLVGDQKSPAREQVDITIEFPAPVPMSGMVLMPRQNLREHEGDIKDYVVEVSDDGNTWSGIARGELLSTFGPQTIGFTRTITTRYLRLVSINGFGPDKTTSLAELAVIYAGPKLNDRGEPIEYRRNRSATPDIDEGPGPKPTPSPKPKP